MALNLPAAVVEAIAGAVVSQLAPPTASDGWLNVEQAADHLACERHRIYDLVRLRKVRHVKDGSRTLFRAAWLDAVLVPGKAVEAA